jgi:serine/threonine-protein kinase
MTSLCPTHEQLQQLLDEQLDASAYQNIAAHVQTCHSCQQILEHRTREVEPIHLGAENSAAGNSRYRPLRWHAKGGLGEVFVALDQEIDREVALKRIQAGLADDAQSRARFLLEAEVTGRLEHPGVVPVYGLGQYPNGQPYYAMRFIQGDSLKDAIRQFHEADRPGRDPGQRSLAFRALLRRFIDVCNTVAYAHSRGVLHRDLKPANVMLGKFGETLVVDWGLAKVISHSEEATEAGEVTLRPASAVCVVAPTEAGAVVGTPAYMSPEQAGGQLARIGPVSDAYSLGATLYELVTGQAPFGGGDVLEILLKVRAGRFSRPRQVNGGVPPALEAICLKAMALKPEERYATAQDLATDIEHWLADEPVSAYREPLGERLRRWRRRHQALVTGATAVLLTAVVMLAAGAWLIWQQKQAADHNLTQLRRAVDTTVTKVADNPRLREGNFHELRKELLEYMVPLYEEITRQKQSDPELEAERGLAYGRLAIVRSEMGYTSQALADYERAATIFQQLAAAFPTVPRYRKHWATTLGNQGILLKTMGRDWEAEAAYRRALDLQEQLAADFPKVAGYRQDYARSLFNRGYLLRETGHFPKAEASFRQALDLQEQLAADFPNEPQYRRDWALSLRNWGLLLRDWGRSREAEAASRRALDLQQQLAATFPTVPEYRQDRARSLDVLCSLLREMARLPEAEACSCQALELTKQLADDFPAAPEYRWDWARTLHQRGLLLHAMDRLTEAEAVYGQALELRKKFANDFPNKPRYRQEWADSLHAYGVLLHGRGRLTEAETTYRQALDLRKKLATDFPTMVDYRESLALSLHDLGLLLYATDRRPEAEAVYRQALTLRKKLADDLPTIVDYAVKLGDSYVKLGLLIQDNQQPEASLEWYGQAIHTLQAVLATNERLVRARLALRDAHRRRAQVLTRLQRHAEAAKDWDRALELAAEPERLHMRLFRAAAWAQSGEPAKAVGEADALAEGKNLKGGDLYDLACVFALVSAAIKEDAKLIEQHATRAIALLSQAQAAGYFKNSAVLAHLKKDEDLNALRSRPDFQQLLASLDANGKAEQEHRAHLQRAIALVQKGEHAQAVAEIAPVLAAKETSVDVLYNAGCVYALSVAAVRKDPQLAAAEQDNQAEAYARRAIAILRQAVTRGFNDLKHLKTRDPDLELLRGRADFQKLMAELEAKAKAQKP